MSFLSRFYPTKRFPTAYEIPYERLYAKGLKGVLFDIDNTLVPQDAPADDKARALFGRLRALGLRTCLLSNNKEARVRSFAEAVGTSYVHKAGKPGKKGICRALQLLGTTPGETLLVGDQLFTDIWCGNRAGMRSVLVSPICPKEDIQIILKRIPERLLLRLYEREREAKKQERQKRKRRHGGNQGDI